MKKSINEIAKFQRLAGLITESEYQETITNEGLPVEDTRVEKIIQMLKDLDVDGETMEYIIQQVGMGDQMANQLVHNKTDLEEAKIPVSKDKKIQVLKEWIWYTCDEGQAKDDINKYNKMIDIYFADKDDVTKEDFKKIWAKVTEKYGVGDVGADWDAFPETWNDIQRGRLVNPFMKYEGKEKVEEDNDFRGTDSKFVKRDDGCYRINDKGEESKVHHTYCRKDVNEEKVEEVSSEAFERMNSLVNRNHILSLLAAAEGIMGDLSADGFEVEDIRDYINQIIVNDI